MGQIAYRGNLSAALYPMTLERAGRTVIVPGPDNQFDRRVDPAGEQKDAGIPQALYLENVMPTANGYQSVGYKPSGVLPPRYTAGPGTPSIIGYHEFFFGLSASKKNMHVLFRVAPGGYEDVIATDFVDDPVTWVQGTGETVADPEGVHTAGISKAYVRGANYIHSTGKIQRVSYAGANVVNITDESGSVTGITIADIVSICSSANYLIALTSDNKINWSSTTTPLDFTPSLVTGAGFETPADLKSRARFLTEAEGGFYIYSDSGVVFAQYTGNARYPWKFTGVDNAGGYTYPRQVVSDRVKNVQYAIDNTSKLKVISGKSAELIAPEVTTYLERDNKVDQFASASHTFSKANYIKPSYIYFYLDRYVFVPISLTPDYPSRVVPYTGYFLVYDTLLQRYGRLKVNGFPIQAQLPNSTDLIFIYTGCNKLSFDIYNTAYSFNGVIALGKFQYARSRLIKMSEIELEGVQDDNVIPTRDLEVTLIPSLDGKNFDHPVVLAPSYSSRSLVKYPAHKTGENHTVVVRGAFDLVTLALSFSPVGGR